MRKFIFAMIEFHGDTWDDYFHNIIDTVCYKKTDPIYFQGYPIESCEIQFAIAIFAVFNILKYFLTLWIFPRLFRRFFSKNLKISEKFGESLYYWLYYVSVWTISLYISSQELWFWKTMYYWVPGELYFPYKFKLLYLTQFAFYASSSVMIFASSRRKHSDRYLMLSHHALTSLLIASAYIVGQWRIGMIVFLLHDIADVFLELSKLLGYVKLYDVQKGTFVLFLLAWFVPRWILYPWRVVNSSVFESKVWMYRRGDISLYLYFNLLLLILWSISAIWSVSISGFAISVLAKGAHTDYRSDEEQEESTELQKKKK